MFYYPIKLHYSQTQTGSSQNVLPFYYPIKLHYRKFLEEHPDCKNGSEKLSLDASEYDSDKKTEKAV